MAFRTDHQQNEYSDDDDSVFRSLSFPRYCPKPRPTRTQYIPATPRAIIFFQSGETPSSNSELSRATSSATGSSFFFTISSHSSSSSPSLSNITSSYRCTFRGKDAIGYRRRFPPTIALEKLKQRLSLIGSIRHANDVQLLGASMSPEKEPCFVDLVYSFVNIPTLSDCLTDHNNINNFYSLYVSTWQSRIEIALGVARGMNYIHNMTGFEAVLVHNRMKSSNIIVTLRGDNKNNTTSNQPGAVRPLICKFGLAQAAGEAAADEEDVHTGSSPTMTTKLIEETEEEENPYLSPELRCGERAFGTQKSDVYAFGVLLLELLSGAEPVANYHYDAEENLQVRTSIIETARATLAGSSEEKEEEDERVRGWVDGRLNGFFPVKVAEKVMRLALHCLDEDPETRPDMGSMEGVICDCWIRSKKLFF